MARPDTIAIVLAAGSGGQFSSAQLGRQAALDSGASRIIVHPVDMPAVRTTTLTALLRDDLSADGRVPEFDGAPGHPLLLSRKAAEAVLAMGDVPHLEAAQARLQIVRMGTRDPGVLVNFNTPEVYERLLGSAPHPAPAKKQRGEKVSR